MKCCPVSFKYTCRASSPAEIEGTLDVVISGASLHVDASLDLCDVACATVRSVRVDIPVVDARTATLGGVAHDAFLSMLHGMIREALQDRMCRALEVQLRLCLPDMSAHLAIVLRVRRALKAFGQGWTGHNDDGAASEVGEALCRALGVQEIRDGEAQRVVEAFLLLLQDHADVLRQASDWPDVGGIIRDLQERGAFRPLALELRGEAVVLSSPVAPGELVVPDASGAPCTGLSPSRAAACSARRVSRQVLQEGSEVLYAPTKGTPEKEDDKKRAIISP